MRNARALGAARPAAGCHGSVPEHSRTPTHTGQAEPGERIRTAPRAFSRRSQRRNLCDVTNRDRSQGPHIPPAGGQSEPPHPAGGSRDLVAERRRLLRAYDRQLRGPSAHLNSPGVQVTAEGPLVVAVMEDGSGMVMATGLAGLGESEWRRLVSAEVEFFSRLGRPFEWKTWSHDHPRSFLEVLADFGFRREAEETVLVGASADIARHHAGLTSSARLRPLTPGKDFVRLGEQLSVAFGEDQTDHAAACEAAARALPDHVFVLGVEVAGELVATGRLELMAGTDFGTLWGGSVVPRWRHQGMYRALVVQRARLAAARGFSLLQVDALPTSRPILERLGLVAVCTTTPYRWEPVSA